MDKTAALIRRASEVRRHIFASLPLGIRFAEVFTMLASDASMFNDWGKAFGVEFLMAGVKDMPDPGPLWFKKPGDPRRLPSGYMAGFIAKTFKTIMGWFHDPNLAEEAIGNYYNAIREGRIVLNGNLPLESVQSYVQHGCLLKAQTLAKAKFKADALTESLQDVGEDDKGVSLDIPDPKTMEDPHFLTQLQQQDPHMMKEWMDYLSRHIHPDAGQYIQLLIDGYEQKEIVGSPTDGVNPDGTLKEPGMLTHYKPKPSDPRNWFMMFNRNFGPLSKQFFKSKGENLSELVLRG